MSKAWLAHTEFQRTWLVRKNVLSSIGSKGEAEEALTALADAKAPQMAPTMLYLTLNSKAPKKLPKTWLDEKPSSFSPSD